MFLYFVVFREYLSKFIQCSVHGSVNHKIEHNNEKFGANPSFVWKLREP